ncbi:ATP-dependent DNA helicase RecQ [Aerococcus urinaehominis]|uniref:DNA helicase RecQ n=1 Tax=Aerococcus urinaehominis TaxID=128944 RepID=A0A0X8FM84_9LACT|nr:DNA helicase RecQ [Aerococcus urinaehominis]AMB99232.1 ATP-dependent DNA helicase RecQ [Aerococcus urinaehominis]SDM31640.1 ATP-dependent DNA helicase RecQ [Aerococcus urinaehominis]
MSTQAALEKLQEYFGYSSFRPGQDQIIEAILAGHDCLAILPTGGGKSICYQIPALLLPGLTVVISPLISLMKDQVDSLNRYGIPAAYLNSATSSDDYQTIVQGIYSGQLKLLYLAPERLDQTGFADWLAQQNISMLAVDEAHCLSQWGHDFRPSYRQIKGFLAKLAIRPVLAAFTATATARVQADIIQQLDLNQPQTFVASFDRPNIRLTVQQPEAKMKALMSRLNHDQATIIYAQTRKNVDKIYDHLKKKGYATAKYHAGLTSQDRQVSQEAFIHDQVNIIVATNAFGMGIDKTDVRQVIHYNMPTDLESYYQEAGRAGRDGLPAEAVLLFSKQDIMTAKFLIRDNQDPYVDRRLQAMIQYANQTSCLRHYLLAYFGEDQPGSCGNCSVCLGQHQVKDMTREAQMILSCLIRMGYAYGATLLAQVLRGANNQKIRDKGFDRLSTYGLMQAYPEGQVKDIISQLLADGYLRLTDYRGLVVTERAREILAGTKQIFIKEELATAKSRPFTKPDLPVVDDDLYEILRQVRYRLAKEEGVPAYVIFSNQSLADMANQQPTEYSEFLAVEGVGEIKAEKYWEEFTQAILDYQDQQD